MRKFVTKRVPITNELVIEHITGIVTVGLDLSLNHTGFVIMQDGVMRESNQINSVFKVNGKKKKLKGLERQIHILDVIFSKLKNIPVDCVAIESYSYGSRGSAIYQLAELGGMIRLSLTRMEMGFQVFAPQTLKKFMIGHRDDLKRSNKKLNAKQRRELRGRSKQAMVDSVEEDSESELIGYKPSDDEADAYGLAKLMYGISYYRICKKIPKSFNSIQEEVVRKWAKIK